MNGVRQMAGIAGLLAALALYSATFPEAHAALQASAEARLAGPSVPYHHAGTLVVSVDAPKGSAIQWPEIGGKIADVDLAADPATAADKPNERLRGERVYHVDAVKPGLYRLPDLQVTVTLGDESATYELPPVVFEARELTEAEKAAAAGFEESAPLVALEPPASWNWRWMAVAAVIAAAVALLWRRFHRGKPQYTAPPKAAWDVALARLHELRLRNLPIQGQTERYYVDLSAIVRYYIEDRFGLRAPEQTTPEFLDVAAQSGRLTEGQQAFLALFLRHCDRVKFARHEPGVIEMEQRLAEVEAFVTETIPGPAEGSAAEDAA